MSGRYGVPIRSLAGPLLRRPALWPTALRLVPPRWWRRWPPLPVPPADYLRFRMETMYGSRDSGTMYGSRDSGTMYGSRDPGPMYGSRDSGTMYGSRDPGTMYGSGPGGPEAGLDGGELVRYLEWCRLMGRRSR